MKHPLRYTGGFDGPRLPYEPGKVQGFLLADPEEGEGDVVLIPHAFDTYDAYTRLDILLDWINLLQFEYEKIVTEYQSECQTKLPNNVVPFAKPG